MLGRMRLWDHNLYTRLRNGGGKKHMVDELSVEYEG